MKEIWVTKRRKKEEKKYRFSALERFQASTNIGPMRDALINLWVDNAFDLTQHRHCTVVGEIALDILGKDMDGERLHRPRHSIPPQPNRILPADSPPGLLALYEIAKKDMRCLGFEADDLYLYALYHSGMVAPTHVLREGQWHFDLMRNLRDSTREGKIPVAIGYGVSTILPTTYTTGLFSADALPTRETVQNMQNHHMLGETTQEAGLIFQPRAGQVVRYDSLILHRGTPNRTSTPLQRGFIHTAFSPIP